MKHKAHEECNIKHLRKMSVVKQESLAYELGAHWSQNTVSFPEQKGTVILIPEILL